MDLIAALALVMVLEGLALAVFARSIPKVLSEIDQVGPETLRRLGFAAIVLGALVYLWIRS